ncbi:hypothetical protein AA11825_1374 [Acetobacter pomorum DSM 11825]|nr:hypothetical protein AA11825_1374 [Acetobacter pomorum DSM 11825]
MEAADARQVEWAPAEGAVILAEVVRVAAAMVVAPEAAEADSFAKAAFFSI